MTPAKEYLRVFQTRLKNSERNNRWSPEMLESVKRFVANLEALPSDEVITGSIDDNNVARYVRASSSEVIGEVQLPGPNLEMRDWFVKNLMKPKK